MLIGRAWLAGGVDPAWADLRARLARMDRPVFPLSGRDVLAYGIAPGPRVGALLEAVRQWWLDGGCVANAQACAARLEEAIRAEEPGSGTSAPRPAPSRKGRGDEPGNPRSPRGRGRGEGAA